MLLPLLIFLALALTAASSPLAVALPPDQQLALIARIGKPYVWSLSSGTFTSTNGPIICSTPTLPPWLSFDPGTLTFRGTPSDKDEGYPRIRVIAKDSVNTVSATLTLCVSRNAEPTINIPISQQFSAPAPSLSSVFLMSPNSGIATDSPGLRIPPKWSFSIGFPYETFISPTDLYYEARQRDGFALPEWMVFDSSAITVNGVTPKENETSQPAVIPLSLYVSDQEGYSSACLPFVVVVSQHEISAKLSSVTFNITAEAPFSINLSSQINYLGLLVDGRPIEDGEIKALTVDTSEYGWMNYDHGSRILSGDPGNIGSEQTFTLPMTLQAFNQSLQVLLCLVPVPSYFSAATLSPIQAIPGEPIDYNLQHDFSDVTKREDDKITSTFDPPYAQEWLSYNPDSGKLTGTVPFDFTGQKITVKFLAYSSDTHSTSCTKLPIELVPPDHTQKNFRPLVLSAAAHTRLALGLGITFGVVGGLCLFAGLLAVCRRYARVEDAAIGGEEGRNVWSERDKKWYSAARGHAWSERDSNFTEKPILTLDQRAAFNERHGIHEQAYGELGLGLRRVSERSQSEGSHQSPGVMRKREFFTRLRETVRVVSDRLQQGRKISHQRPVIGRPILPQAPGQVEPPVMSPTSSTFFQQTGLPSHPGSTIMTNSPSASTAEHSIPRRRADFAPPRAPAEAHTRLSRQLSSGSSASNTSERMHASEAVVKTASIVFGRSASGRSFTTEPLIAAGARPRLVPFTSASRVPVPHRPSPPGLERDDGSSSKRVNSQKAKVWRREPKEGTRKGSSDELKMGLHYVQSFGAEPQPLDVTT